jgi:uncharacterized protein YheU (UPF0270 family)
MIIPWQTLSQTALNNLIEEFVTRDGTDYGRQETTMADKVNEVQQQLRQGRILIVYSHLHATTTLLPADHFCTSYNSTSE